jgi:hypothetical protein
MQLDRTRIAIYQRSWLELVDLTLIVLRHYWRPLCFWAIVGVAPMMLINQFLLWPMLQYEELLMFSQIETQEAAFRLRYQFHSMFLVFLEAPLAMLGVTYYLGQAVFVDRPSNSDVWKALRRETWRSLWILGIARCGLLGMAVIAMIPKESAFEPGVEIFWVGTVIVIVGAVRSFRPFAPEMLVLERSPLWKSKAKANAVTYGARHAQLHGAMGSDLMGRFLVLACSLFAAWTSLSMGQRFLSGTLFGRWEIGWWDDWILTPINLWGLALFATVFRFLSYLDTRIRIEGWELRLRMQAEAQRMGATP